MIFFANNTWDPNMLSKDLYAFVALLKIHKADQMTVGDYALGVHGYPLHIQYRLAAAPMIPTIFITLRPCDRSIACDQLFINKTR